jgi:hypothetical protein
LRRKEFILNAWFTFIPSLILSNPIHPGGMDSRVVMRIGSKISFSWHLVNLGFRSGWSTTQTRDHLIRSSGRWDDNPRKEGRDERYSRCIWARSVAA